MRGVLWCCLLAPLLVPWALPVSAFSQEGGIRVTPDEAHQRVDITLDGLPFTSYIWPSTLKKPTLYPLIGPGGIDLTRGYPLNPQPGDRTDHPHQVGMWLNYGNVNGFDFWNNSDAIKPDRAPKMGTIFQERVVSAKSGANRGELVVESVWTTGAGQKIIDDTTRYVFLKREHARVIDQVTTLKALDRVVFNDDKEGMFGIRVARWLESPTEKGGSFLGLDGKPGAAQPPGAASPAGVYLTSEGKKGDAVWSTRGRWCVLTGSDGKHTMTIAIIDHPLNPDYPTYWHARGYGLFAANPLGRHIFDPAAPPLNFTLEKGQTATFRYRVLLISGTPSAADMNREADAFAAEYRDSAAGKEAARNAAVPPIRSPR